MSGDVNSDDWRGTSTPTEKEEDIRPNLDSSLLNQDLKDSNENNLFGCGVGETRDRGGEEENGCDSDSSSDISVGGRPSHTPTYPPRGHNSSSSSPTLDRPSRTPPSSPHSEDEYFKPLKRLRMMQLKKLEGQSHSSKEHVENPVVDYNDDHQHSNTEPPGANNNPRPSPQSGGVKSFSIHDILNHEPPPPLPSLAHLNNAAPPSVHIALATRRIVRPWDTDEDDENEDDLDDSMSVCSSSESCSVVGSPRPASEGSAAAARAAAAAAVAAAGGGGGGGGGGGKDGNPLDALFQMTSNTFNRLKNGTNGDGSASHLNLFSSKQPPKKKRKSRTAFNNHQLFELEKRFLYQKYLSPADRDELSQTLGLSNAQVITWFQNRRAKLKRDMEELKKDVHTASILSDHTVFIKTMTQMGLLKTRPPEPPPLVDYKN